MTRVAKIVIVSVGTLLLAFAAGNLSGFYFYPRLFIEATSENGHDHADEHGAPREEQHVVLTREAFHNLGVKLGDVSPRDYWKTLNMPGEVVEIPGRSNLSVAAPVSGTIERIPVLEGQAVGPGEPLFSLHITDDELMRAQSSLLATLSRQDVLRRQLARLVPLTEAGTVSGQRKRDIEYELDQTESARATFVQEIEARGLPSRMLDEITQTRSLATEMTISVPTFGNLASLIDDAGGVSAATIPEGVKEYSVEELRVHPGKSVQRGDDLCELAYHSELYIQGRAFEGDLPALVQLSERGWRVRAEFGHENHGEHSHTLAMEDLMLLHVDNHVDRESQTFQFYLPLPNRVIQSATDREGRVFQEWRFKPGQRVHLKVPVERWPDQFVLPRDAVAVDGANSLVFVECRESVSHSHSSTTPHHSHHASGEEEPFVELEPVPVRLLHRDGSMAVVADEDGRLTGARVALTAGYKLYLAFQTRAGSGGGRQHHHDH